MISRQKRIMLFLGLVFALAFFMSACGAATVNPTVSGLADYEVMIGSEVPDVLEGIELANATLEDVTVDYSRVNMERAGTYIVTVTIAVEDVDAIIQEVTINVYQPKIPTIEGAEDFTYYVGEVIPNFFAGVTASDYEYGDISSMLQVDVDDINFDVPGVYEVEYAVENIDGYRATTVVECTVLFDDISVTLPDEFIIVEFDGLFGLRNNSGIHLLENSYDAIEYIGDYMLMMTKGDVVYYYNGLTKEITDFEYHPHHGFNEGLAVVKNDENLYGFMNKQGEIIIPFIYTNAYNFYDGEAKVYLSNTNVGTIDQNNNMLVPIKYHSLSSFIDGHTIVGWNTEYHVLDENNNILLELSDTSYYPFLNNDGDWRYTVHIDGKQAIIDEELNIVAFTGDAVCFELNDVLNYGTTSGITTFYTKDNEVVVGNVSSYQQHFDMIVYQSNGNYGAFKSSTGEIILDSDYMSILLLQGSEDKLKVRNSDAMYGVVDEDGAIVFDFEALSILSIHPAGVFYYQDENNLIGLLNADGAKITSQTYTSIYDFTEGLAVFKDPITSLYGYLNLQGEEVVDAMFYYGGNFFEGYAIVKALDIDEGWTVIDVDGNYVGTGHYYSISLLQEGFFKVQTLPDYDDGGYTFMNESGVLLPGSYAYANTFYQGYSVVRLNDYSSYGLIDTDGTVIVPTTFSYTTTPMDGYIVVGCGAGQYGYYDVEGNYAIPCEYNAALGFNDGFALVRNSSNQYGMIDKDNNVIIDYQDNTLYTPYDGRVKFRNNSTFLYGYYDIDGNEIIPAIYNGAADFSQGLAIVQNDDYDYGYINTSGDLVVDYIYQAATMFDENGYALVNDSQGWGMINTDGVEIFESKHEGLYYTQGGFNVIEDYSTEPLFVTESNGVLSYQVEDNEGNIFSMVYDEGWMLYDNEGSLKIPVGYDEIRYQTSYGTWSIYKDDMVGYYDAELNKVLDPEFDNYSVSDMSPYVFVFLKGNEGVYNKAGVELVPAIYDSVYYYPEDELFKVRIGNVYGLFDSFGNELLALEYSYINYINENGYGNLS